MYDKTFLEQLMDQRFRTVYARIISLNFEEQPLEQIEGRVTSGSINLDGVSAVRRTCSLTLLSEMPLTNYYWTLNTKFKLAIGIKNEIDNKYPGIIWFEQGVFIISSFSSSQSLNTYSININGKDKMCLLNGELGGTLPSSVDFGTIEQSIGNDGDGEELYAKINYHIRDIIREAVHTYGNEPFHNILINDIDEYGLELQEYQFDKPMYVWRPIGDSVYQQATLYGEETEVEWYNQTYKMSELEALGFVFDPLVSAFDETNFVGDTVLIGGQECHIAKIDYGETAGYKEIPLVYPDELILKPGETVVTLLDKIKNFLGDFEYFYNIDGQFIFQKKATYLNTPWNPINGEGEIDFSLQQNDQYSYIFSDASKFASINLTPTISNLKNDFVIWGENKRDKPIHMRYSIHKKPFIYTSITVTEDELKTYNDKYGLSIQPQTSKTYIVEQGKIDNFSYRYENGTLIFDNVNAEDWSNRLNIDISFELGHNWQYNNENVTIELNDDIIAVSDWREIIYQMSQDYKKYNHLDDFEVKIIQANQNNEEYFFKKNDKTSMYCTYFTGKTGYEQYYIDMDGFWRQIYDPFEGLKETYTTAVNNANSVIGSMTNQMDKQQKIYEIEHLSGDKDIIYYTFDENIGQFVRDKRFGWSRTFIDYPDKLLFWIDFLDFQGELENFSVPSIGLRTKTMNDTKVKAIYYQDTPDIIFYPTEQEVTAIVEQGQQNNGYRYFQVPNIEDIFKKSTQGKTAKDEIDNLLYNHGYCSEAIAISAIPIYYLQPNTRIFVNNNDSIIGDYIISKITIPLQYNGMMNITANKAPKRFN